MKINLNGSLVETQSHDLKAFVVEQGLDPVSLIVEYNYQVVKQDTWAEIHIKNGDNLELLSFVGGG
ncbi:MAG: sulfur carrier protein ThiS [Pseudomonadota bacterium]